MLHGAEYRADLAACRDALRGGSRSFFAASWVLPGRIAGPATALYAFCREADDLIDRDGGNVGLLTARLDGIYGGRPAPTPADRAMAEVVHRFALPRALLDALLEGFAWDAAGRRYATLAALEDYAARVAGTVGAAMAVLMDSRTPALLARACDLGVAMQLTNIARDVGEDAALGRLYLPLDWLAAEGIDPDAWLAAPRFDPALGRVVARLLARAAALYAQADTGIAALPWDCRAGIAAARLLYAGIGAAVARQGHDSVARRAVVRKRRKAALLARAALAGWWPGQADGAAALPACQFLVTAAYRRPAGRSFDDRVAWVCDLFSRLERQRAIGGP